MDFAWQHPSPGGGAASRYGRSLRVWMSGIYSLPSGFPVLPTTALAPKDRKQAFLPAAPCTDREGTWWEVPNGSSSSRDGFYPPLLSDGERGQAGASHGGGSRPGLPDPSIAKRVAGGQGAGVGSTLREGKLRHCLHRDNPACRQVTVLSVCATPVRGSHCSSRVLGVLRASGSCRAV